MTGADDLATEIEELFHRADCIFEEFTDVLQRARALCEKLRDQEG